MNIFISRQITVNHFQNKIKTKKTQKNILIIFQDLNFDLTGNACRNPDKKDRPWCFTSLDPVEGGDKPQWSDCLVPRCDILAEGGQTCRLMAGEPSLTGKF